MQVILIKSIRKLGQIGEIVTVAKGYGRNYLIPQKLATRATHKNLENFSLNKQHLEKQNLENKQEATKVAQAIDGSNFNFILPSSADGRLFGSVSLKAIAIRVSDTIKTKLNYSNILLDKPIKFNGVYTVEVVLHPEITSSILVVVAKTEPEALNALERFKNNLSLIKT